MAHSDAATRQDSLNLQHRGAFANHSLIREWATLDAAAIYDYSHDFDSLLDVVAFTGPGLTISSAQEIAQSSSSGLVPISDLVDEGDVLAFNYDSIIVTKFNELLTESEAIFSGLRPAGRINLRRLITKSDPSSELSNLPYSGGSYLVGRLSELPFIQWVYWSPDDEGITVVILGSASNRGEEDKVYDIIGNTLQTFGNPSSPAEIVFINLLDYTSEERKQFPLSGWQLAYDRSTSAEQSWALVA